jgi:phosphoglycolate phosphatase-like HAD superfamily hydrolase
MAAFIFDFDGTIADTFPLVVDISYQLSGGAKRLPETRITELRELPLLSAIQALGISRWHLPRMILLTRPYMLPRMREVKPFPDVIEAVKALHKAGHTLYILTSNRAQNVHAFFRIHGLEEYFDDISSVYHGNVFYKIYGIHKLLHRHKLSKDQCYYVGNEPLDMVAAERSGIHKIAVSWSGINRTSLQATYPDFIIDNPKQLLEIQKV